MSISNVVSWWEEWQLRILVLGSLTIQLFLALSAPWRKWPSLHKFYRLAIWVSYLGGDALAIYALATLFNRQKNSKLQYSSSSVNGGSHDLEVLWAPILLIHLGGRMTISAYNIEDNELWLRHVGVAISQVAVTLYVFCKSWSHSADKRLLATAILLFILGIFRCFEKPIALRRSSFNALVSSFLSARRTKSSNDREVELEKYIQDAREIIIVQKSNKQQQQQGDDGPPPALDKAEEQLPSSKKKKKDGKLSHMNKLLIPDKLFVDYVYDYDARLEKLESLWLLDQKERFEALRRGLSKTFTLIYTKLWQFPDQNRAASPWATHCSVLLWNITLTFPAPIVLFHISHKQVYKESDIKVTYVLLYITFVSEMLCMPGRILFLENFYSKRRRISIPTSRRYSRWFLLGFFFPVISVEVAQHSLVGVLADKRIRRPILTCIANCFCCCKDFPQKHLFGRSYSSMETSISIIELVHAHVRDGWMDYIRDVESYWKFTDMRGHWTLERNTCQEIVILRDSVEKPLDESIILWHLATYFCFHQKAESIETKSVSECASMCRCISNYMMHLLSSNPEMLLPGSRPALFQEVCKELDAIPKWPTWACSCLSPIDDEKQLKQVTEKVIEKAAADKSQDDGFLHDAWVLAQGLMQLADAADGDDGKKMWQVIKGVWIEMLCFSACRCRGYLHAKGLAYGGEFLTVVSLLMSHAGLETFAERQQRVQLRLPKDVRQEKAKQVTIEKEEGAIVILGEIAAAATPSSASASASQGECTAVPAMEVVVVTS